MIVDFHHDDHGIPEIISHSPVPTLAPWMSFVSGMSAGTASALVGQPFDTVRIVMQTSKKMKSSTNAYQVAQSIVHDAGFRGLYRGLCPQLCNSVALGALMFGSYVHLRHQIERVTPTGFGLDHPLVLASVAGFGTGICTAGISTPLELLKCQRQVTTGSSIPGLSSISSWFRGFYATLVRQSLGNAIFFGTYQALKDYSLEKQEEEGLLLQQPLSKVQLIGCGSCAGAISWTLVYPLDVIKSHVQITTTEGRLSYRQVVQSIVRESGVRGFTRGIGPTIARSVPVNGMGVLVYEAMSEYLRESSLVGETLG